MGNDISIICRAGVAMLSVALLSCATEPVPESVEKSAPAAVAEAVAPQTQAVEVAAAAPVELQTSAPLRYVVKKGDTLWGIATIFLKDPWQWPELWYANPGVRNPHLIYPGDELYLYYVNGQPRLARAGEGEPAGQPPAQVAGGPAAPAAPAPPPGGTSVLSPRVREEPLAQAIYSIPLEAIRGFLRGPRLIDEDQLDDAPYIVDFEEDHLMAGNDTVAYVLELESHDYSRYQIVRRGHEYRDPDDNDVIGYEVLPVGESEVRAYGDPSTVYISRSDMEALPGDYLLPLETDPLAARFFPHAPANDVDGRIISVYNGVSQIGQYQIVAINRGTEQGMEPGHVLTVLQTGRTSRDPYSFFGSRVQLPEVKAGTVMVFKCAPRLSYALVMSATREIHLLDKVERPDAVK